MSDSDSDNSGQGEDGPSGEERQEAERSKKQKFNQDSAQSSEVFTTGGKTGWRCGRKGCPSILSSQLNLLQHHWRHEGVFPRICISKGENGKAYCGQAFRYQNQYYKHRHENHDDGQSTEYRKQLLDDTNRKNMLTDDEITTIMSRQQMSPPVPSYPSAYPNFGRVDSSDPDSDSSDDVVKQQKSEIRKLTAGKEQDEKAKKSSVVISQEVIDISDDEEEGQVAEKNVENVKSADLHSVCHACVQQMDEAIEGRRVAEQHWTFLEKQLNRSQTDLHLIRDKLAAANQEQNSQQQRIQTLEQSLLRVEADCATKQHQITALTENLRVATAQLSVFRKQDGTAGMSVLDEAEQYKTITEMSETEIYQLHQNFQSLRKVAGEYHRKFLEAKDAAREYQKKYEECEKKLSEATLKLEKLQEECKKTDHELASSEMKIKDETD